MYQFLRVESYARDPKKGANARDVAAEAERKPSHCSHVEKPQAPKILFGSTPTIAVEKAEEWAETHTDPLGRKIRKDGMVLLSGVISYPNHGKEWEEYKADCLEWLKEKYGENLECVVEHTDEEHPHLHFYAVPRQGQSFTFIHDGRAASEKVKKEKGTQGQQKLAFSEQMRLYQDHFYSRVSRKYGLARLGPKRQRLTRDGWKSQQTALQVLAASAKQKYSLEDAQLKGIAKVLLKMGKKDLIGDGRSYRKEDIDKVIRYVEKEVQKGQSKMQGDAVKIVADAIANGAELEKENKDLTAKILELENDFKRKELTLSSQYNIKISDIENEHDNKIRGFKVNVSSLKNQLENANSEIVILTKKNNHLADQNNDLDAQVRNRHGYE